MGTKPKVLIVEDELEVSTYLKEFLQQQGLEVWTAATGEEGLDLFRLKKPNLVLLDLRLGSGISGLEVLRRVKGLRTETPILVVTAVADRNVTEMAKGLGADDYVTKPFVLDALKETVFSYLKKP